LSMNYDEELRSHGAEMTLQAESHEAAAAAARDDMAQESSRWADGPPPDYEMRKHRDTIRHHENEALVNRRRADHALRDPAVHLMGPDEVNDREYMGRYSDLIAESYARGRAKGGVESLR